MARTREEQREHMRAYRARKRAERAENVTGVTPEAVTLAAGATPSGATVTALPGGGEPVDVDELANQSVLGAVLDELHELGAVVASRPGLARLCVALAELLDDEDQSHHHSAASRALADHLRELRGPGRATAGKLEELRAGLPRRVGS